MITTSISSSSVASMRAFGSSKSISSFARDIMAAPRLAEVASTAVAARNTRRRVRAASIFAPSATGSAGSPSLPPTPISASTSSASITSSSSTKSFKSFAKELAITRRLGDLNVAGQQARTCRGRRARAATFGRSMVSLVPSPSSTIPPLPLNASTISFGRRALIDRPMIAKTVREPEAEPRRLFSGTAPTLYAKLDPQEQLAMRVALLGKPAEKPKGVKKLLQALKRA